MSVVEKLGLTHSDLRRFTIPTEVGGVNVVPDYICLDTNGDLVVVELEGAFNSHHILFHLVSFAAARANGDDIKKVVWLVDISAYQRLRRLVDQWKCVLQNLGVEIPRMLYATPSGEMIY